MADALLLGRFSAANGWGYRDTAFNQSCVGRVVIGIVRVQTKDPKEVKNFASHRQLHQILHGSDPRRRWEAGSAKDHLVLGFHFSTGNYTRGTHLSRGAEVVIPYYALALLFSILPALWLMRRKHPPGTCQACGYNLTGNVSGKCPECGAPLRTMGSRGEPALRPQSKP